MARNDDPKTDRMRLSEALWNLRCGIARVGNAQANTVSFGRMLTDPGYRARIIRSVRQSESPELQRLAAEAARHNVGELAETPVSWDAAGRTELELPEEATAASSHHPRRPRFSPGAALGATTLALMLAIAAGILSYLFSPRLAAVLAGEHRIEGPITSDTTWSRGRTHVLSEQVFVTDGATLTIEAGARIEGEAGSALVVTAGADLQAQGRRDAPIVFTSARPQGERQRGDWGGVVLLGDAPVNTSDAHVEGIAADDARGDFGGSAPRDSCGVLKFARIAYAGHEIAANVELNGLTLGGCGSETVVRHVQVRQGLDDGIEVFGGTVNLKQVVVTGAADDSLDWDLGWQGQAQFLVLQQGVGAGDNGIEADNNRADPSARPRSRPTIAHLTLVSPPSAEGARRAMLLRRGTGADLRNVLAAGFSQALLDVRGGTTARLAGTDRLRIRGLLAHAIGEGGQNWVRDESGQADDDGGFDEARFLRASANRLGLDPKLPGSVFTGERPDFAPAAGGPASSGAVRLPQGEFWVQGADFIGAVRPGQLSSWVDGWTRFAAR